MRTGQQPISALFTLGDWQPAGSVPANPGGPAGKGGGGGKRKETAEGLGFNPFVSLLE